MLHCSLVNNQLRLHSCLLPVNQAAASLLRGMVEVGQTRWKSKHINLLSVGHCPLAPCLAGPVTVGDPVSVGPVSGSKGCSMTICLI